MNILPQKYLSADKKIRGTDAKLRTWDDTNYTPIGQCRNIVKNPKNNKKYNVNFIICHDNHTPIIGLQASKQMKMIQVREENFERTNSIDAKYDKFNHVFNKEVGTFEQSHKFLIKEGSKPCVMPSRRVPIALKSKVKSELDKLVKLNVIEPVNEPSEWVSQFVVIPKKNNEIRICLDPQELNKVLVRERYTLPILDETLHELSQSKVFSKFDCSHGYWHVKLDNSSSKLTTFQTPYGCYRWLRLPFGVSVAAEIFQKKLNNALHGLHGVICVADDIVVHGTTIEEHDANLSKFLERCSQMNIRLNKEKTELRVREFCCMGHKISDTGMSIDPSKIEAIDKFPPPDNVSKLRSFIGIVNFVSKFLPKISEVMHPLYNLLKKDVQWTWSETQRDAFKAVKVMLTEVTTLAIFDPNKPITIENDASEYGLGSCLSQDDRPIAYASRLLTQTEQNYAQIEKEMLAIVFGLQKFHHYVYGQKITIITDHKPLTFIVQKALSKAPKRIQNMIIRTNDYSHELIYKLGSKIPIAHALS